MLCPQTAAGDLTVGHLANLTIVCNKSLHFVSSQLSLSRHRLTPPVPFRSCLDSRHLSYMIAPPSNIVRYDGYNDHVRTWQFILPILDQSKDRNRATMQLFLAVQQCSVQTMHSSNHYTGLHKPMLMSSSPTCSYF